MDDAGVVAAIQKIIETSPLSAHSESSEKVIVALKLLLGRRSPEFYESLKLLPPGYLSGMVVSQVFLEASLSLDELLATTQRIEDPAFAQEALDSGISSLRLDRIEIKISISELEKLRKLGLQDKNFSELLLAGYNSGNFSIEEVARNVDSRNNSVLMHMGRSLSKEQLHDFVTQVYREGRKIDSPSLKAMATNFAQTNAHDALVWAQGIPGPDGNTATDAIFHEWMEADPIAASKYLAQMKPGQMKDQLSLTLIKSCIRNKALQGVDLWADQIGDAKVRSEALRLIEKTKASSPNQGASGE